VEEMSRSTLRNFREQGFAIDMLGSGVNGDFDPKDLFESDMQLQKHFE